GRGHRRVNWGIYAPQPPGLDFAEPTSIPPGEVTREYYTHLDRLLASAFPPDYEAVIRESPREEVSIQPIYDDLVDSYVHGRVLLIGDAGTVTRPHTRQRRHQGAPGRAVPGSLGTGARRVAQVARRLRRRAHGGRAVAGPAGTAPWARPRRAHTPLGHHDRRRLRCLDQTDAVKRAAVLLRQCHRPRSLITAGAPWRMS